MRNKILILWSIAALLIACGQQVDQSGNLVPTPQSIEYERSEPVSNAYPLNSVYRYVDEEYGNVCYVYVGNNISCLKEGA